jgi:hypothetical protein
VPLALDALVLALLAPDPADRPAGAAAVSEALSALVTGAPAAPVPAGVVGRAAELERLRAALDRAWAGAARAVLVTGEPGIGKTTLLEALAAEAERRGGATRTGRAEPEGRVYEVWRPVVGELRDAEDQLELFDAVAAALAAAAAERPLLVVLDDLHWADASSLRLLAHVVDAEPDARLLIAASSRTPLDVRAETLELAGLAADAVRALLPPELEPEAIEAVHARTAGNPFYVAELGRALAVDGAPGENAVPARVREAVRGRVAQLGAGAAAVLEAGAVAGRFTIADVARAAGAQRADVAAALDCGIEAGLIVPHARGQFSFAHAIVRDAVREALPARRHGALHEALAGSLRSRRDAGADVSAARIAHHALAAARLGGDPQPAWECGLEAAAEAAAALGHAEAAARYEEALEALGLGAEAPSAARRDALLALADATFAAGDIEAARRRYVQAAAAARRERDADSLAHAALGFARVHPYGMVDTEGVALLSEALDGVADAPLRARVMGVLAVLEPEQERREALIDAALALAGDEATRGWLYPAAVTVNWRPQRAAQRAAAADEVVRGADHSALVWAYLHRVRDALEAGDVARADADLDRSRAVAQETRRSHPRWMQLVAEAGRAAFAGRLEEADALGEEALALNRRHGEDCYQEHTVAGLVLARLRRRPQDADRARLRGYAARYPDLPVWEAMLACLEWELGDAEAARRGVALCARDGFAAVARSPDFLPAALCLADPTAGAGEPAQVERLYELLLPHAAANPVLMFLWGVFGPVARGLGLLAAADDRPGDAAAHFERALRLAAQWDAPGWELRIAGDWLATGVPVPDRAALVSRGVLLAGRLGLPGVASQIADAAQTITP